MSLGLQDWNWLRVAHNGFATPSKTGARWRIQTSWAAFTRVLVLVGPPREARGQSAIVRYRQRAHVNAALRPMAGLASHGSRKLVQLLPWPAPAAIVSRCRSDLQSGGRARPTHFAAPEQRVSVGLCYSALPGLRVGPAPCIAWQSTA